MIRVEKTHLPVAALTHPGMKGKNNEDRFGVSAFRMKTKPATPVLLAVLSDGIGGNRAGEVASELTVNLIIQSAAESDGKDPTQILQDAIQLASQRIFQQAQGDPEQHGMGATCACAWISGDRLFTATVGDSRIYLMRDGVIQQLSTDHTWIQEALERGLIQPDEVSGHPNAHVIRRYLGSPTPPEVDFRIRLNGNGTEEATETHQGFQLLPGDCVLLCSDGLTDLVNPEEILNSYQESTLEEAGQQLINLANQRGGHDNITLIAIEIPDIQAKPAAVPAPSFRSRSRMFLIGCLSVILFAAVLGGLAGGWLLYSERGKGTPTPTITVAATITPYFTRTPTPYSTPGITPSPFKPAGTQTPARLQAPGRSPSLTPWPTNTPALPVVTLSR